MLQPAITLSHVTKVFSTGTIALQDVSLTVGDGEFLSLVGPSGCGKSTILSLIAGLSLPTQGDLCWQIPEYRQELAFVFQDAALLPWSTVKENIRLPLKLAGISRAESDQLVDEAIELVGLTGFEKAFPRQLSGGMRMRASIARAIVTQPKVLLMDEPFGALDEITRNKLNEDVMQLWHQKRWTVIFVTHNIYEAVYLSTRVAVMGVNPGRIVDELQIDEPYPRSEAFRQSAQFGQYRHRLATALATGMGSVSIL
ncbi:MAG: ABC transporter ATP-binding protein [Oscillatoriales cyanobacterium]|nr:MAG: ABC transporter ATP-binding protein [Oscillatoriales cyanobacterium]